MYAAVLVFVLCLTVMAMADHHQPCHSPNMTGKISVADLRHGPVERSINGDFIYDPLAKKLRIKVDGSTWKTWNVSKHIDLLMFFEEGVFYEIDGKNQSCEKKTLHSGRHFMEIGSGSKFVTKMIIGSPKVEAEGLAIYVWSGTVPETKGYYSTSVTMGCIPVSSLYISETASIVFSLLEVETEIKDPDLLALPSFCEGEPVEETPEGTANSFLNVFL